MISRKTVDQQQGKYKKAICLLIATLALAGCQSIIPRGAEPDPTSGPAPVEGPADDEPVTNVVTQDSERHRVALLLPLTGSNSRVGQSLANATTLALLDINASNIRITSYDTANGATAAAQQAIADGNKLILGPLLSDNVVAAANIARPANVPIISYSNDTGVAGGNVFLMGFDPDQSIQRVVSYARSKGVTDFAGLVPSGVYGQRASSSLLKAVRNAGGQVVGLESYNRSQASLNNAVRRLSEKSPYEALLIGDSGQMAIRAVPIVRNAAGDDTKILGTELWNTENALIRAPAVRGAWFASVSDGLYRQYADKYRQRFGNSPFRLSSLGYDSVLLTFRIARNWDIGTPFPTNMLYSEGGFVGLDGAFRFTRQNVAQRALEVQEIRSNGFAVIDPAPRKFDN